VISPPPAACERLLTVLVLNAAFFDIRTRRIPNWLCLAGLIVGLALGFALYFPLWLLHARGAGDVKLLAAAGSFIGPANIFVLFLLTALCGGAAALFLVIIKGRVRRTAWNVALIIGQLAHFRAPHDASADLHLQSESAVRLPHALAIAAGWAAFLVILHTHRQTPL
jgi:prepilin peptidase CpaA